jgi:hypothetical protein
MFFRILRNLRNLRKKSMLALKFNITREAKISAECLEARGLKGWRLVQ